MAAFSIQLGRNLAVQATGIGMVCLMVLSVLPWPLVLLWTGTLIAVVVAEHRVLRLVAGGGPSSRKAGAWAPRLRVITTILYALAALALFEKGGLGQQMFAFALITASMVHVLMRHYRSPWIMAASISPYILVLGFVGFGLEREQWEHGHLLSALAPGFTIALIAVQFWSARAQLSSASAELTTARQTAEERERAAEAANRAKSQFLANMGHELRTPLNGVIGMARVLANSQLSQVQYERVDVIRRSGECLLTIFNDLLDLSRIESSTLTLEVAEFDLERKMRAAAETYQPLADEKGLTFSFEIAGKACGRYMGDPARIQRILHGLMDNAVKFTETGGVKVRVFREGDQVAFSVTDTGIGISDSDLTHLFEGFFQADATSTRRYGGAGVGLAICNKLAHLMDGEIRASSRLGEGSTFTFLAPLQRADSAKSIGVDQVFQAVEQAMAQAAPARLAGQTAAQP